jgi:hypothetical protein
MAFIHTGDPYPGWRAALPVAGTLLLMEGGGGNQGAWANRKILSNPAVVWMGLISYPLYLFHWPALAFVHIVNGANAPAFMIWEALGVALVLTLITYYGIEKRIRYNKSPKTIPILVGVFVFTGIWGWIICRQGFYSHASRDDIFLAVRDWHFPFQMQKMESAPHVSIVREGSGEKITLYLGDSDMQQYGSRIVRLLREGGHSRSAIFITGLGCPPIPDVTEKTLAGTDELMPEFFRVMNNHPSVDRVVIAANWVWYLPYPAANYEIHGYHFPSSEAMDDAFESLKNLISHLQAKGVKVYLVLNIPIDKKQDPKSEVCRSFNGITSTKAESLHAKEFNERYGFFLDRLGAVGKEAGAVVIDPRDYLVSEGIFPRVIDGIHLYKDAWHLRDSYVRDHVKYLDQTVEP